MVIFETSYSSQISECLQEWYDKNSQNKDLSGYYDENDECQSWSGDFVQCPLCRASLLEPEKWVSVEQAFLDQKKELKSFEKRAKVSEKFYISRIKKKQSEIEELKKQIRYLKRSKNISASKI